MLDQSDWLLVWIKIRRLYVWLQVSKPEVFLLASGGENDRGESNKIHLSCI